MVGKKSKPQVRQELKQARGRLPARDKAVFDRLIRRRLERLDEIAAARVVFIYLSTEFEVDTRSIIDRLSAQGKTVLAPKISGSRMQATPFRGWDSLAEDRLGILAPIDSEIFPGAVEVSVAPGLGFAADGRRIGYGKGYYDQWFAAHPQTIKIALCYERLLRDDIPMQANDALMDKIVTERRVIECDRGGG